LDPDRGSSGIDAAKSQFLFAARQIVSDLGIDAANVKHNVTKYENDSEFYCDASGEAPSSITITLEHSDDHGNWSIEGGQ